MPEKLRQPLALLVLFGGWGLIYAMWGLIGLAGSMLGLTIFWLTFGIASGYWIGIDPRRDVMVMELMKRTKARLAEEDDQAE